MTADGLPSTGGPGPDILGNVEKQKLQYATIIDVGKASYDSFFKLGAMSFTLNGALLAGLSIFQSQATSHPRLAALVWAGVAVIGVVYNLGAGCAFMSLSDLTSSIWERLLELDGLLGLGIADKKSPRSNLWGTRAVNLTILFFTIWVLFWFALLAWAASQFFGPAAQ